MRIRIISLLIALLPVQLHAADPDATQPAASQPMRKLACVGDSITHGSGTKIPARESYPAQLAGLLGPGWDVRNFGVSGATLLDKGDRPYTRQRLYKAALDFKADVVVILLGTNDSKPQNWKFKEEFAEAVEHMNALVAE